MKDTLVQQCLDILKREDIKCEIKTIFKPVIDFILLEINPLEYREKNYKLIFVFTLSSFIIN